jgi:hypothetical protein
MTIMKQEGIHTKCVAIWVHNVEVMSVRQHSNVLSVIAISIWCLLLTNRKPVKLILMKFHVVKSYWNMWTDSRFCWNQTAITGTLHEYVDVFLSAEETEQGIPVWGIHSYLCKQREGFLVSFIPPTQVLLTPGHSDLSGAIFKSLYRHFFNFFTPKNAKRISIKFFNVSVCLIVNYSRLEKVVWSGVI